MMPLLRILTMVTLAAFGTAALAAQERAQEKRADSKELTQAETELRVKNDMARRLSVRPEEVRIAESSPRIWPDAGLGCNARRGLFELMDVPGSRSSLKRAAGVSCITPTAAEGCCGAPHRASRSTGSSRKTR